MAINKGSKPPAYPPPNLDEPPSGGNGSGGYVPPTSGGDFTPMYVNDPRHEREPIQWPPPEPTRYRTGGIWKNTPYIDPYDNYQPVGNGQYEATYQQGQVENPEWNYQTPPVGEDGRPLGMNNEPLPEGAQGWTPFGEPDWGPNFGGWWKGALYNIFDKPEKTVIRDVFDPSQTQSVWNENGKVNQEALWQNAQTFWGNIGANISGAWAEKTIDPTTGERIVSAPGPLTYVSRGLQELLKGAGQALDVPAQFVESVAGTASETLEDLGAGSALPEFTRESDTLKDLGLQSEEGEWRIPKPFGDGKQAWDLGWAQQLANMTPIGMAWNGIRALTAPKKSWDEVQDIAKSNWQASRIAFSAFGEESLKQEFIARYKAGEDPRLLAMELGQPWQELAGKFVADPLNALGGGARKAAPLLSDAEKSFKAAPEIQAALDAVRSAPNLNDAEGIQKLQEVVNAAVSSNSKRLTDLAQNAELFGRTATSKRAHILQRTGLTFDNIVGASLRSNGTLDSDKALRQIESLLQMTSGNPEQLTRGLGYVLGGAKADAVDAGALLSQAGQETGLVLRRILDDGTGVPNPQKFIDELAEAKKLGDSAAVDYVTKKLQPALDEMFPTVLERTRAIDRLNEIKAGGAIAEGEDVAKLQRLADLGDPGWMKPFFSGLYEKSRPAYNFVNGILGNVYMGMSPGYAVRNSIGNNFQAFVDLGPEAWGKGSLFNPDKMAEAGFAWGGKGDEFRNMQSLGGISSKASSEGISSGAALPKGKGLFGGMLDALTKGEPWKAGLRVGEVAEANAAKRIIGYTLDRTMRQLTGKAVPVADLTNIGLSAEQANTFRALLTRYAGDTEAAFKGLRAVDNVSLKSVLANLSPQDVTYLKDFDAYDPLVEILENVGTKDDLFNRLDDLADELEEIGSHVKSEHVAAGDDPLLQVVQASPVSDNLKAVTSNQITANKQAWDAYKQGAREVYDSLYNTRQQAGQPTADIQALWQKYFPWISDAEGEKVNKAMDTLRQTVVENGIYGSVANRANTDMAKLWGELGLSGPPPKGLTREQLRSAAWDHYFNTVRPAWRQHRDLEAFQLETFLKELATVAPDAKVDTPLVARARELYQQAKGLDDATMVTRGNRQVMVPVQGKIAKLVEDGKTNNAIRELATQYGIGQEGSKLTTYYDRYIRSVLKKYGVTDLKTMTLEDAHRAFEARLASKSELPRILNLDEWLKTPEKILNPPPGPGPSFVRGIHESVPNLRTYLDDLKTRLDATWGQGTGSKLTPDQEKALSAYLRDVTTPRMQEARRMAAAVATEQRKFTILDYGDKTNFDLALSMIMPYHFWYSRTYKNWMTRMIQNPKLLADYARYRETLEQIHAESPEWWRYNINTNELLGTDMENPIYFNLEAALNPLNGLTGVDFNDPKRRVDWWTRTLDDASRFGPSIWSPITWATAYALHNKGETEAAARWGGRLFPQTATLKAIGALGNLQLPGANQYNEYDPFVNFFSGGLDPWEQGRVGRAFGDLVDGTYVNGEWIKITPEQADEAAHAKKGELWDLAVESALDKRGWGQITSYLGGVGFKGRNASDIEIDEMYQQYYSLWNMAPNLKPEEFRLQMEQLKVQYPWMDAVLLAKKSGPERDRALAYNALGRVPPGQAGELLELFNLSPELMAQFYDNKGDLSFLTAPDRDRFMAGIIELSAALALPEDATRYEWAEVRSRYAALQDAGKAQFGEDIWQRASDFFALSKDNPDAAKLMMANNPNLQAVLDWKEQVVMSDPLLFDYYGGIDFLEKYWEGQMYDAAKQTFGQNIFEVSGEYGALADAEKELLNQYYDMKDAGDPQAKAFYAAYLDKDSNQKDLYLAQHPELKSYWSMLDDWRTTIEAKLLEFEPKLRDVSPDLRPDYNPQGIYELPAAAELGYQFPAPPTWEDYQQSLSAPQVRLLQDYFAGGDLSPAMERALEGVAENMDMTLQELLSNMQAAYYSEQVPVP